MGGRYRDFSGIFCPHTCITSPTVSVPHQCGTFITTDEPTITNHHHITQSPQFTLRFTLDGVHSMGLNKCIMTCTHHYGILQSIFTALNILCIPLNHLCSPNPCTTDLFIVPTFLPFPECYRAGIVWYVAFSDWLPSCSKMHLSFLQVFSWLNSSFLFSAG